MDCATSCVYPEENVCEFFIFEAENLCHMGNITGTLDGSMTSNAETFQVYLNKGKLTAL